MLTNAVVAHGIALDAARLKGHTVLLWRRKSETSTSKLVDTGMAVGDKGLANLPKDAVVYARYVPLEAIKHMIRMSMTIPWRGVAFSAALRDAGEHAESQTIWELADDVGFFNCHESIDLTSIGAKRLEVIHVS